MSILPVSSLGTTTPAPTLSRPVHAGNKNECPGSPRRELIPACSQGTESTGLGGPMTAFMRAVFVAGLMIGLPTPFDGLRRN
jgi:hypothetical protein